MALVDPLIADWMPTMVLLVVIGSALNVIVYLIGTFLQNDKFRLAGKMGFVEIFYSLIIMGMVVFGITAANSAVLSLVSDGTGVVMAPVPVATPNTGGITTYTYQRVNICELEGPFNFHKASPYYFDDRNTPDARDDLGIPYCHIRVSLYFLRTLFDELDLFAFKTYSSYLATTILADFALNLEAVNEKAGMFTMNPFKGFFHIGNLMKTFTFETAVKLMTLVRFQEVLISFISQALFPALFVLGLILRSFGFTRRIGGLLMAIALVLFFIFPMFYIFPAVIVLNIKNTWAVAPSATVPNPTQDQLNPPIADYLYVGGTFKVLGDPANQQDPGVGYDLTKELEEYKRTHLHSALKDSVRSIEDGTLLRGPPDPQNRPSMWNPDFGAHRAVQIQPPQPGQPLTQEQLDAIEDAKRGNTWFLDVVTKKWYDPAVPLAFESGGMLDVLGRLAFFATFFGLMAVLASIAAIRTLSIMLGGDIEIAGLTHLI